MDFGKYTSNYNPKLVFAVDFQGQIDGPTKIWEESFEMIFKNEPTKKIRLWNPSFWFKESQLLRKRSLQPMAPWTTKKYSKSKPWTYENWSKLYQVKESLYQLQRQFIIMRSMAATNWTINHWGYALVKSTATSSTVYILLFGLFL